MNTACASSVLALFITGGAAAGAGDLVFTDPPAGSGLTGGYFTPNNFGMQFMAGGAAAGDFDRDGDQDLFVPGGPSGTDQLYINDGSGHFQDRAADWGVDAAGLRHTGAAVGDFNDDGYLDIYVTAVIIQGSPNTALNRLYKNNGDGTFTDIASSAGVQINPHQLNDSFGSAFGDYDLDGDLDLFVAGWTGGNTLYRNNGDETFTPQPASVFNGDVVDSLRGFSPRFCDVSGDGWPDLLVGGDFFSSRVYINQGNGTFTNETAAWGAGLDSNGMGSTVGDFNNDGLFDWYVTSRIQLAGDDGSGNMLYVNRDGFFEERSHPAGVNLGGWGWGTDAIDFDNDGWQDIAATNGFPPPFLHDPTTIWINQHDPDCLFTNGTQAVGVTHTGQGRGLLTFDADSDGDRDLLIVSSGEPLTYYRNDLTGGDTNAVTLLFDTSGEPALAPDGFGVHVELDSDGLTQYRELDGGCNYLSQSELSLHFGLAGAPAADVIRITWPGGAPTTLVNVPPGRYTITARHACPVDWNTDGTLDLQDVTAWINGFLAHHPQADLSIDGVYDLTDLALFVTQFLAGCQ